MSLNHGSQIIADVRVQGLTGQAGIGIYQLHFSLLLAVPAINIPGPPLQLSNLRAKVFAVPDAGTKRMLGLAFPEAVLTFVQLLDQTHNEQARAAYGGD